MITRGALRFGRALAAAVPLLVCGVPPGTCVDSLGAAPEAGPGPDDLERPARIETVPLVGATGWSAALLMSGESGGTVDGALAWTSTVPAGASQTALVTVVVEVDGRQLLEDLSREDSAIEVFAYLLDGAGTVVGRLAEGVPVEDDASFAAARDGGLKFIGTVHAPAGASSLRVVVRNGQSGRFFLDAREIEIPHARSAGRLLLPPLAPERDDRWVIASREALGGTTALGGPKNGRAHPSAKPVWLATDALSLTVLTAGSATEPTLTARLVDPTGAVVAAPAVSADTGPATADGLVLLSLTVAPPQVPPGVYRLEVLPDGAEGDAEGRAVTVVVSDDPAVTRWTDPAAPRAPRPEPAVGSTMAAYEEATRKDAEEPPAEVPEPPDPFDESICAGPAIDVGTASARGGAGPAVVASIASAGLAGVDAGAAALLMSGQSGGQVDGAVIWTPAGAGGEAGRTPVVVVVEVDGQGLVEGSVRLPVPIEIYGYLLDGSGSTIEHIAEGVLAEGCRQVRAVRDGGLRFVGVVRAPVGRSSLRIIVRNRETRRFFLARRDLEVPGDEPAAFALVPPLVVSADGGWVATGRLASDPEAPHPRVPGFEGWPSGMPVWRSREPLQLLLGSTAPGGEPQLKAQLADGAGVLLADPVLTVGPEAGRVGSVVFRRATVSAPDVPPGEYRLAVVLGDRDSGETVSQVLPVVIHDVAELDAWIDPRAPRDTRPPSPERLAAVSSGSPAAEPMRGAYLEALRLWSRDDAVAARRRLAEIETPPVGTDPGKRWRQLFTEERLVVLALAKERPDTVMAVAMLHRDMHGWYMARRDTDLAEHSWQMSAMIARMASDVDGLQAPPGFSECLLVDLATQLARAGLWQGARRALEMAIGVAPDSAPALLGLGALLERMGDPMAAVEALQTLVQAHPDNREGRLRLAVNRARLGAGREAGELFRGLLDSSTRLWIRTLAYQELGRLLISEGRADEAAEFLGVAVEAIPSNQRLRIMEAFALEAAGRLRESGAAVERLDVDLAQQTTSPRYLYSRWPELDEERVRAVLSEADELGRAALREVLP